MKYPWALIALALLLTGCAGTFYRHPTSGETVHCRWQPGGTTILFVELAPNPYVACKRAAEKRGFVRVEAAD